MRKLFLRLIVLVVVILFVASFIMIGCKTATSTATTAAAKTTAAENTAAPTTAAETTAAKEVITLNFANDKGWSPTVAGISPFSEKAIGVAVKSTSYNDPAEFQALMKQGIMSSESSPDFLNWWSGYRLKDVASLGGLEDLSDLWKKHIDAGEYDPSVAEGFKINGKYYGSLFLNNFWTVLYNKHTFDELNLKEPQTWEEFIKVCDTIKAAGKTPIDSYIEGKWYSLAWFEEVLIRTDPALYEGVCDFSIKYSDPRVVNALKTWTSMIEKGYFPKELQVPITDLFKNFVNGDAPMLLIGDWAMGNIEALNFHQGVDYDAFIVPMINPEAEKTIIFETSPICIPKKSPHLQETKALFDYWLSPEGQTNWNKTWEGATVNKKATVVDKPIFNKFKNLGLLSGDYRYINRFYENTPVPVCEFALDKFVEIMLHPDRLEPALAEIDKFIATQ
ncbi:MAG: ABC transporter substrate-binding protein [Candidatus Humimicrobiaceae bacterium]